MSVPQTSSASLGLFDCRPQVWGVVTDKQAEARLEVEALNPSCCLCFAQGRRHMSWLQS